MFKKIVGKSLRNLSFLKLSFTQSTYKGLLNMKTISNEIKKSEYAVRGAIPMEAERIA